MTYEEEMAEVESLMPSDPEWDVLTALSPPPQSWYDEEWGEPPDSVVETAPA